MRTAARWSSAELGLAERLPQQTPLVRAQRTEPIRQKLEEGELQAADELLEPLGEEIESDSLTAALLRLARGRLRIAQGRIDEGLADFRGVGRLATSAQVTCPGYLAWRSEAALAHLALGEHEFAKRLADEELELARTFGAPRALGVAQRAAGLVTGGEQGVSLLREVLDAVAGSYAPPPLRNAVPPVKSPGKPAIAGALKPTPT